MNFIYKLRTWLERYRWAITMALVVCVIMQHCTITTLQKELKFVRDKYEVVTPNTSKLTSSITISDSISTQQKPEIEAEKKSEIPAEETTQTESQPIPYVTIIISIILLSLLLYILYKKGKLPFGINVNGKLWQDLNGRIVYTLTVKNKTRKDVLVENAMIEFMKIGATRKFRMPVTDFPITLSSGTSHSVNISLQKLFEQNQQLFDYKAIRTSVDCNKRLHRTLPLGVKWKR